ncbi:MAG: DNA double-strand break repair nuclease NurA [Candidatus Bathyarchaeota archaeon]|nr:MAG: DNA double-strand break repair nuclease NurA [Candidatus Bathyarchaeota archaeon]
MVRLDIEGFQDDFDEMKKVLKNYIDNGHSVLPEKIQNEPSVAIKIDPIKFYPLKKMQTCDMQFYAVDCSTRTLKRANNWGIYLFRVAYATVRNRRIDWDFKERIRTIRGDSYVRRKLQQEIRLQLESETALGLLHNVEESDYVLLDGASYFGGERKFDVLLFEKCKKKGINLLNISKQSPILHDEKGRDLIAMIYRLAPIGCWVYYPVKKANIHEHLYGHISIMRLSGDSPRAFRCDIMSYLADSDITRLLSPLLTISEDPRSLGYPVVLWLAHDFSGVSETKLLLYHACVEEELSKAGLREVLQQEENACNFADELHGAKYAFNKERV